MKISKSQKSNLIFFGIIAIIFFTPLRGIIQEFVAKTIAMSPSTENVEDRITVSDYSWNLKGLNTVDFRFEEAKNKVIFINYWATWCPPCRAEMPAIQSLYTDYKDKVKFIFVTNENAKTVNNFLEKHEYDLPSYNEFTPSPKEFQVSSIPATYVLNKKGEIVIHKVGPAAWDSKKVRKLLDDLLLE